MLITDNFRVNLLCDAPSVPAALLLAQTELQKYLSVIFAGTSGATEVAFELALDPALAEENYILRAGHNLIAITGGSPRGALYGAYAFLRDVCGCRFFTADTEFVPRLPALELDDGFKLSGGPAYEYRDVFWTCAFDAEWSAKNAVNGNYVRQVGEKFGGGVGYALFVHTFNNLLPPDAYFAEHPEYFAFTGGKRQPSQLCLTNPDVLGIVIENTRAALRKNPGCRIISVSQNDCAGYCECEQCRAADEAAGSHMGTLLPFINAVADAIKDEFPDVAVDTLAYQYTRQAPKGIIPRGNVIIRLCSIECCFSHSLESCNESGTGWSFSKKQSFKGDLEDWAKLCKRLYVWNYTTNFAYYQAPFPNIRTLVPNIRWMYENHVVGLFDEGCFQTPSGEFGELRAYLHAAALRDPYINWIDYYTEFMSAYYGGGWRYIDEYINLTSDIAERIHMGIYMHPSTIIPVDAELVKQFDELWDKAEAEAGDEQSLSHVRRSRIQVRVYKSVCGLQTPEENAALLSDIRAMGITYMREGAPIPVTADPHANADKWV
jgi:Glycosyl hydrolase family 67 N-terminus.